MAALIIEISNPKKLKLIAELTKQLGGTIISETDKTPNKVTLASMKKTASGVGLTKTTSHTDLMKKLNS